MNHQTNERRPRSTTNQGPIGETDEGETIYEDARADVLLTLSQALGAAVFPVAASGEDTEITVPFVFE